MAQCSNFIDQLHYLHNFAVSQLPYAHLKAEASQYAG